ncbi:hypothetical protein D3C76_668110 [compost metagenome]
MRQALISRRRSGTIDDLALGTSFIRRRLGSLLRGRHIAVRGLETIVQLGDARALAGQGAALIRHGGAQRLQGRRVCLGLSERQGIGCGGCRVRCSLVGHRGPGGPGPALRRIGVACCVDPQVLWKTIRCRRCRRLDDDLTLSSCKGVRSIGGLLRRSSVTSGDH